MSVAAKKEVDPKEKETNVEEEPKQGPKTPKKYVQKNQSKD